MLGGLLKSASAVALVAAASLYGASPARAADLGGDCCADLEERVAELEATTVRKGNRKVSVTLSGFVAHHIMWWDDGTQSDMYVGDSGFLTSRFRFTGTAKITPQLTAGFLYEFGATPNALSSGNQLNGGDNLGNSGALANSTLAYAGCGQNTNTGTTVGCPAIRQAVVWLQHSHLGRVSLGQQATAADAIISIDVASAGPIYQVDHPLYVGSYILRGNNGAFGVAGNTWQAALRGSDTFLTDRANVIMYTSPTLAGFALSASYGEDNFWDIALRYAGEFGGFRIAGAIGYTNDTGYNLAFQQFSAAGALCSNNCDLKTEDVRGSVSVMHMPTGLFVNFSAGTRELTGSNIAAGFTQPYVGPDTRYWHIAGGISQNWFGIGRTVLMAEYGEHRGGLAQASYVARTTEHCSGTVNFNGANCDSQVSNWGVGINQNIDAAAMEVFLAYKNYALESNGFTNTGSSVHLNKNQVGVHDFSAVFLGSRINF